MYLCINIIMMIDLFDNDTTKYGQMLAFHFLKEHTLWYLQLLQVYKFVFPDYNLITCIPIYCDSSQQQIVTIWNSKVEPFICTFDIYYVYLTYWLNLVVARSQRYVSIFYRWCCYVKSVLSLFHLLRTVYSSCFTFSTRWCNFC